MVKQRKGTKWIKERRDKEGILLCLVPICNKRRELYKNSRTRNYCEDHDCMDLYKFNSWHGVRIRAFKRDNHTCVKCGKQPKKKEYKSELQKDGSYKYFWIKTNKPDSSQLIGDHIIPIALGGEEFNIDNVQTLCIECNKIKTKQDAKDIAKQRRKEKLEAIGQKTLK